MLRLPPTLSQTYYRSKETYYRSKETRCSFKCAPYTPTGRRESWKRASEREREERETERRERPRERKRDCVFKMCTTYTYRAQRDALLF